MNTQETAPLTAAEVAEFERATAIRMARQAHAEAEEARREQAERDAREAGREAAELTRRSMGIRSRTGEEVRADLAAAQAEDDQYEAARATIARIDRRRAVRRQAMETEARADALAQVAGQSARAQALHPLQTYPLRLGGLTGAAYSDPLYGELAAGGPMSRMAEAVRALLPPGRVTREAVVTALRAACVDPQTGELGALR
jgi:hypothetical protein